MNENIDLAQVGFSDLGAQSQSSTVSMFKELRHTLTGAFAGAIVGAAVWIGPFFWFLGFLDSISGVSGGSSNKTWGGFMFIIFIPLGFLIGALLGWTRANKKVLMSDLVSSTN